MKDSNNELNTEKLDDAFERLVKLPLDELDDIEILNEDNSSSPPKNINSIFDTLEIGRMVFVDKKLIINDIRMNLLGVISVCIIVSLLIYLILPHQ